MQFKEFRVGGKDQDKTKLHLKKKGAEPLSNITEDKANAELTECVREIGELQTLLYSSSMHSVLVILQGMDTSGKDGTISHVFSQVNALGCHVEAFKTPTNVELAHDFLWRVHAACPPRGILGIFNRSHYEDVLVGRVHSLVPKDVWKLRYNQINNFEQHLVENNTIIFKFFLHISKDEQRERLEQREKDASKAWKLAVADWEERAFWDDYMESYEDVLLKCDTKEAPWFVIPSNKKWYRNWAIAKIVATTLREYEQNWNEKLKKESKQKKEMIANYRANS